MHRDRPPRIPPPLFPSLLFPLSSDRVPHLPRPARHAWPIAAAVAAGAHRPSPSFFFSQSPFSPFSVSSFLFPIFFSFFPSPFFLFLSFPSFLPSLSLRPSTAVPGPPPRASSPACPARPRLLRSRAACPERCQAAPCYCPARARPLHRGRRWRCPGPAHAVATARAARIDAVHAHACAARAVVPVHAPLPAARSAPLAPTPLRLAPARHDAAV